MNIIIFVLVFAGTCAAVPQFFTQPGTIYAHPAVLLNTAMENTLPYHLKNDFYKNPRVASKLAKESWFTDKEMQVIDRETDKIPREKIFDVLHNAGFTRK